MKIMQTHEDQAIIKIKNEGEKIMTNAKREPGKSTKIKKKKRNVRGKKNANLSKSIAIKYITVIIHVTTIIALFSQFSQSCLFIIA